MENLIFSLNATVPVSDDDIGVWISENRLDR